MPTRKWISVVLVVGAGLSALALAYVTSQPGRDAGVQRTSNRLHVNVDAGRETLPACVHSKIKPSADILLELTDAGEIAGPVKVAVHAASLLPVRSATISLKVPAIGDEPERTETLWSSDSVGYVAETCEYTTVSLPVGAYRLTALLEFVPEREGAEPLIVAESLFLDIRPDTILSSAVSFDHIKRVELLQELEDRDRNARHRTMAASSTKDPDIARRIEELNRIDAVTPSDGESGGTDLGTRGDSNPRRGQPASEVSVPVRPQRVR